MFKRFFAALMAAFFVMFTQVSMALTEANETAIQAGFDANQASGENVGIMVILFVLALAVIGLVINMVRKT